MNTRADRIEQILKESGNNRLKTGEIRDRLRSVENAPDIASQVVTATVATDNNTRDSRGEPKRFRTYGDGEQHGFIALRTNTELSTNFEQIVGSPDDQIPQLLKASNDKTRDKLRNGIAALTWRQFESNFLGELLEVLGFHEVQITQPSRDDGKDALCSYRRGLVSSEAIVSAKHWACKNVGPDEVQRLRGIKGHADTGIIVTSANFTDGAKSEAAPSQNQRSIVLIDIEIILDACFQHSIGVNKVDLPNLYTYKGFEELFHDDGGCSEITD